MTKLIKMRHWFFMLICFVTLIWSCRTEIPFDPGPMDPDPVDTTMPNPMDTVMPNPVDTVMPDPGDTTVIDTTMESCDTSIVYFESDILPILAGNCALAGCHDPVTAQHDLVLTSYEGLMKDDVIVPFDLDKSELYEKITEDKAEDRMPPPPNAPLLQEQISLIRKWILQGAPNNSCSTMGSDDCDTTMASFEADVKPILNTYCVTCHSGSNPNAGVNLTTHSGVSLVAATGRLSGVISWDPGLIMMPLGGNQIPECDIHTIDAWINQGAMNN